MAREPESKPSVSQAAAARPVPGVRKKKSAKRAKLARPLSEREIDMPDVQTLGMMGVMAATAVVLWGFAHGGCNYHPPRETRRPREVTTAELTRDPKGAAIELQQRVATLDYKGALEIAAGPLAPQLQAEKAACDATAAECERRGKRASNTITVAEVMEREPSVAKVRVTSHRMAEGSRTFLALVERSPTGWKVTARIPEAQGAVLPAPVLAQPVSTEGGLIGFPPGAAPQLSPPTAPRVTPGTQPQLSPTPPRQAPPAPPAAPTAPRELPGAAPVLPPGHP